MVSKNPQEYHVLLRGHTAEYNIIKQDSQSSNNLDYLMSLIRFATEKNPHVMGGGIDLISLMIELDVSSSLRIKEKD